jgi:hypothetical protein
LVENCLGCGKSLPEPRRSTRKYCDGKCRAVFQRTVAIKDDGGKSLKISDAKKAMRTLAFENLGDEVREVLRQEIRDQISQHVKDNVLGAAEVMTTMLPTAMAALKTDLESEDWMSRSRAYALVMKYAMSFAEADANDDRNQNIVVVSGVPTPDTPFGKAYAEEVVTIEESNLEDFEKGWPECHYCHQRKPQGNMYEESHGADRKKKRTVCMSCQVSRAYKRGKGAPDAIADDSLYS